MLPSLTPKQRQRANALIKRLCANYDNGNCLALDNGEPCVCVQSISYSLLCEYFRSAVLPAEPLLEAASNTIYVVYVGYYSAGELLSISVWSTNRDEGEQALNVLNTIRK